MSEEENINKKIILSLFTGIGAFEKAANVPTSNTQLYKQAGNSIVVSVLEKIFINLLRGDK